MRQTRIILRGEAVIKPAVPPELLHCLQNNAYFSGETIFSIEIFLNQKIPIHVLDLCIMKGLKVKFQERLSFREGSRFF